MGGVVRTVKKVGSKVVKGVGNVVKGVAHGDIKSIISVAAMIVAPYVAPAIGGALGLSGALGGAVGGAIFGATTAKLTGGKVGLSTLTGAISGGLAGYTAAAKAGQGPWGVDVIDKAGGLANYMTDTFNGLEIGTTLTEQMANNIANPYAMSATQLADVNKLENLGLNFEDAVSKVTRFGTAENAIAAMQNAGISVGASTAAAGLSAAASLEDSIGATGMAKVAEASAGGLPTATTSLATAQQAATSAAPASWSGAWDKLSSGNVLGGISEGVTKIGDVTGFNSLPDSWQKAAILGGGALLASKLGGGYGGYAGTDQDAGDIADAQYQYLQNLTKQQQEAYENKKDAAYEIMGEAEYYNPHYYGTQAENEAWIKGMSNKNASLRESAGQGRSYASDAEARRANIDTAKNASLAYTAAADAAQNQRVRTKVSGAQLLPNAPSDISGSYTTAATTGTGDDSSKTYFDLFNRIYGTARASDYDRKKYQDALGYAIA